MSDNVHFYGGPLDGQSAPASQAEGSDWYEDEDTDSGYTRANATEFIYTGTLASLRGTAAPAPAPASVGARPEITIHGQKLMTLGQLAQFLEAARAAGYPEDHVPRVVNSFSGRIRSLTAKD
jgi:hypothetical protein